MEYFIANIDAKNLEFLKSASETSGIQYQKGVCMTAGNNGVVVQEFYPIFCASFDDGVSLLREYNNSIYENKNDEKGQDLIRNNIRIALLNFK